MNRLSTSYTERPEALPGQWQEVALDMPETSPAKYALEACADRVNAVWYRHPRFVYWRLRRLARLMANEVSGRPVDSVYANTVLECAGVLSIRAL